MERVTLSVAEQRLGGHLAPAPRSGIAVEPVGSTPEVLLRSDHQGAYPIVSGRIPVLLAPELLVARQEDSAFDLTDSRYSEAYAEMRHYDKLTAAAAAGQTLSSWLERLVAQGGDLPATFPHDERRWLDAPYDALAQSDCYRAMGPVEGLVVAQVGGSGLHAVKFLLAGAARAHLVSPILSELHHGAALADRFGVADRFFPVAAVGEELPLPDHALDSVYSGGSLHHMQTDIASAELARVLRPGGVFACAEPWRSALYALGVGLVGKRESGALCTPLTSQRVAPLSESFASVVVTHHGALTRYLTLALAKAGVRPPLSVLKRIHALDDAICRPLPFLRRQGSSVSVVARTAPA